MDETLIQNAQDNINHENRGNDQQRLAGKRVLKGLSGPPKGGPDATGFLDVCFQLLDRGDRIAENAPGAKLKDNVTEGNGPRWLIASGAKDGFRCAIVSRGICCPVLGDLMRMACKLLPSKCQLG